MYKPSLEKCNKKADKHQHRFVRDGNDHKHQCSHRNGNLVFPHIINLHSCPPLADGVIQLKKNPIQEYWKQVLFFVLILSVPSM